jgi:hypothetical protein
LSETLFATPLAEAAVLSAAVSTLGRARVGLRARARARGRVRIRVRAKARARARSSQPPSRPWRRPRSR